MLLYKEGGHHGNIIYGRKQALKLPSREKEADTPELKALLPLLRNKVLCCGTRTFFFQFFPEKVKVFLRGKALLLPSSQLYS